MKGDSNALGADSVYKWDLFQFCWCDAVAISCFTGSSNAFVDVKHTAVLMCCRKAAYQ
eukprot:m.16455 g.16455  ORF g.16455 m.16455 type:complete len:58 (-) comp7077_c0_seq2:1060-1233(-)